MTMITPSYLGETIEYSSLHACRSTLEDPTWAGRELGHLEREVGEEWQEVIAQVMGLLRERPPDGGMRLLRHEQELGRARPKPRSPLGRLQALVLRLVEGWEWLLPAPA